MAARVLVDLVGNAQYDVQRYPAHVALLTDSARGAKLEKLLDRYTRSSWTRFFRMAVAAVATFAIPFGVLNFKEPRECRVVSTIQQYFTAERAADQEPICSPGLQRSAMLALAAVAFGTVYLVLASVILGLSLKCTRHVYTEYAKFLLLVFRYMKPYMRPVLYAARKPVEANLRGVVDVWQRHTHIGYIISFWLAGILVVLVSHAGLESKFAFGSVLALILFQVYLPVIVTILSADPTLCEIVKAELSRRDASSTSHYSWLPSHHRARRLSEKQIPTSDVWWRLFMLDTDMFTCSVREVHLLIEYFEKSQEGINSVSWPIDWHDRLCLTGAMGLRAVYIDDLDLLLTVDGDGPENACVDGALPAETHSSPTEQLMSNVASADIERVFIEDCCARVEKLRRQQQQRQQQRQEAASDSVVSRRGVSAPAVIQSFDGIG